MNKCRKLLLFALVLAATGCASLCDDCDECFCSCRDKYRSYVAWYQWQPVYTGLSCESDFGSGFRDGYAAMASRGTATVPSIPPSNYWSARYQSEYGQQQTQAWFDGYSHGAMMAEQDGVNQWSRIRTTDVAPRGNAKAEHRVIKDDDTTSKPAEPTP